MERLGFPWAEVAADGSCVIGKHDGTGGQVSVGTVTSQLLYEIGGPRYLGPDVTARFDTIQLEQIAPDRVRISATIGEPPPPTLKVAMNELGGYRNTIAVALTGLDIEAKAAAGRGDVLAGVPVRARRIRIGALAGDPHRARRPGLQRGGDCAMADHRQGSRRAQGRSGLLERVHRDRARQHPRLLRSRRRAVRGVTVRRVSPGAGAGRPRAAVRAHRRRDASRSCRSHPIRR